MIDRAIDRKLVQTAHKRSRIVALLGPRQSGKTTLAREFLSADSLNYFDLEDPSSLARLDEPDTALRPLKGLVVVNEIQRRPDLFPLLRVLADRLPQPAVLPLPPVVRLLGHAKLPDHLRHGLPLSQPNLSLAELPDDLLRSELFPSWHLLPSLGLRHQRFSL